MKTPEVFPGHIAWPLVSDPECCDAVTTVLRTGRLLNGSQTAGLAVEWAAFSGSRCVLPVSSCTHALHLALATLDVGPGDEVIVPALTFLGTAFPVRYVGAKPVFVDVDATGLIDLSLTLAA